MDPRAVDRVEVVTTVQSAAHRPHRPFGAVAGRGLADAHVGRMVVALMALAPADAGDPKTGHGQRASSRGTVPDAVTCAPNLEVMPLVAISPAFVIGMTPTVLQ